MKTKTITISEVLFRSFAAASGGLMGMLIFLLVFMLVQIPAGQNTENVTFSVFSLLVIAFAGLMSANVLATLFVTFTNKEKYKVNRKKILTHVFFLSLTLFCIALPFLIFVSGDDQGRLNIISLMFVFSVILGTIVIESSCSENYSHMSIYGAGISGFYLLLFLFVIFGVLQDSEQFSFPVLLFIMPFSWFFITIFVAFSEVFSALIQKRVGNVIGEQIPQESTQADTQ